MRIVISVEENGYTTLYIDGVDTLSGWYLREELENTLTILGFPNYEVIRNY